MLARRGSPICSFQKEEVPIVCRENKGKKLFLSFQSSSFFWETTLTPRSASLLTSLGKLQSVRQNALQVLRDVDYKDALLRSVPGVDSSAPRLRSLGTREDKKKGRCGRRQ